MRVYMGIVKMLFLLVLILLSILSSINTYLYGKCTSAQCALEPLTMASL